MAIDAQTLFDETKCYACYGASAPDLLKLGLLNRIAGTSGGGGGGAAAWGSITGTLSNQTDLAAALAAAGALGWTAIVSKTADQSVINSTVFVNDSQLLYPVVAGGIYYVELALVYSGTDANDYKAAFTIPDNAAANVVSAIGYRNGYTTALATLLTSYIYSQFQIPATGDEFIIGTTAGPTSFPFFAKFLFINGLNAGNLQFKFACNVAGGGTVTTKIGSTLFIKKLN